MKRAVFLSVVIVLSSSAAWADDVRSCTGTDPDLAIPACTRLLKNKNAIRYAILNNLGQAYSQKFEFDRALELLDESIKLNPKIPESWANRAEIWYRKGDWDRARQDFDQALRLDSKNVTAYNVRAQIDIDRHDLEACLLDFNKLVSLVPKEPIAYHNRALCFRDRGEFDKAIKDLDQAIRLKADYGEAWGLRGEVYRNMGDLDRALSDQNKAVDLERRGTPNSYIHIARGDTYRYRGDLDLALADYDKAIAIHPEMSIPAHTGRGLTFEKKGDLDRARAEFEIAATMHSTDVSYFNRNSAETAKARLAALASGAAQPVIPPAPAKAANATSIPTPAATVPARITPSKPAPSGARRVALVFGNSHYRSVPELENPSHDANAVAQTLRSIGFTSVMLETDDNHEKMLAALRKFANDAEGADWAVVYYAGHGIEMGGVNYLIPTDAELHTDRDVQFETIPFDQVMTAIEGARKLKLVLLDACRDNPFEVQMRKTPAPEAVAAASTAGAKVNSRSIGRGLGEVKVTGASLVVFAAKQGQVALDGDGANSPFAVAVVQRIATPGVEINKIFRLVRDDVMEATAGRQEPYTYGSLPGSEDFFFVARN